MPPLKKKLFIITKIFKRIVKKNSPPPLNHWRTPSALAYFFFFPERRMGKLKSLQYY